MSELIVSQVAKLGERFGMPGDGRELIDVLKATAFKGPVSDAQMSALMVVANQYKLNPFTRELYAFPDKNNGIVPVVSVDGWARIINDHPDYDGIEFDQSSNMQRMPGAKSDAPEWMECRIYRKSRSKPTVVREYLDEVYREPFQGKYGEVQGPWQTHPKRFLRHKTMIQCARLAFGYGGIFDQDEAERIVEDEPIKNMGAAEVVRPAALPNYPAASFAANLPKWRAAIEAGRKSADDVIATVQSKYPLTAEQQAAIRAPAPTVIDNDTGEIVSAPASGAAPE